MRTLKCSKRFEQAIIWMSTKTAMAYKWQYESHIHQLKTDTKLLAGRHMTSCPDTSGNRASDFLENIPTLELSLREGLRRSLLTERVENFALFYFNTTSHILLIGYRLLSFRLTNRPVSSRNVCKRRAQDRDPIHIPN